MHSRNSEIPNVTSNEAPQNPSYLPVHLYTILQIVITVIIFIVTLTQGAPAFPVLIIALVPFRLLVMNKWWPREVLRFVDAWACREGTPEDDEDLKRTERDTDREDSNESEGGRRHEPLSRSRSRGNGLDGDHEWIELEHRARPDEELGDR